MKERINKYKNSKIALISILAIVIIILGYWFMQYLSTDKPSNRWGFPDVDYSTICFAEECLQYHGDNYQNKERIDRELAITLLNESQFVMYHRREPQYLPYIREQLKEAGLPEDLVYLAIAESSLINNAISPSWAWGIWQFMPGTAADYGLRVDKNIDERFDLKKSTAAAIKYLTKLHSIFWNRSLAAAAYNRWENWLQRDLDRQFATSYYDVHLNEETARYVYRIMAIKYLMENRFSIFAQETLGKQYDLPKTKKISIWANSDLAKRSREQNSSFRLLKELNPRILSNELPEWSWEVLLYDE